MSSVQAQRSSPRGGTSNIMEVYDQAEDRAFQLPRLRFGKQPRYHPRPRRRYQQGHQYLPQVGPGLSTQRSSPILQAEAPDPWGRRGRLTSVGLNTTFWARRMAALGSHIQTIPYTQLHSHLGSGTSPPVPRAPCRVPQHSSRRHPASTSPSASRDRVWRPRPPPRAGRAVRHKATPVERLAPKAACLLQ